MVIFGTVVPDTITGLSDQKQFGIINTIDPMLGLHLLRPQFQNKYMGEQCAQLLEHLDEAIHHTLRLAPVREKPYLVPHGGARHPVRR